MMGRWLGGISLLVLALPPLAVAAGRISSPSSIRLSRLSAASPYAGCKVRGPGHNYLNAGVQPQIVVDPRTARRRRPTLLAAWAQDPWSNGGARGLTTALSTDGGRSWRERKVPFGACAQRHSRVARVSNPSLSVGPDGITYIAAAGMTTESLASVGSADAEASFDTLLVATSRDNGGSWRTVKPLPFNAGTVTKVSVAADLRRRATAYVVWDSDLGSWFSRTTDGGTSWSKPVLIVPGQPILPVPAGDVIVVDPRSDTLYLIYGLIRPLSAPRRYCGRWAGQRGCHTYSSPPGQAPVGADLMVMSSTDSGRIWSQSRLIAQDYGVGRVGPRDSAWTWLAPHRPVAAVDPRTGDIAVVWEDSRFSLGRFDEIALSISGRNGRNWSRPVRVDRESAPAVLPSIAINARGVTGIAYYQLRGVQAGSRVPTADYWFRAVSGPARLSTPQRLVGPLDLGRTGMAFAPFVAHAAGMASAGRTFWSAFIVPAKMKQQTNVVAATIP